MAAEGQPFSWGSQRVGILARCLIGGEGENLFGSPRDGHKVREKTLFGFRDLVSGNGWTMSLYDAIIIANISRK
jgi:hypothetical protein